MCPTVPIEPIDWSVAIAGGEPLSGAGGLPNTFCVYSRNSWRNTFERRSMPATPAGHPST